MHRAFVGSRSTTRSTASEAQPATRSLTVAADDQRRGTIAEPLAVGQVVGDVAARQSTSDVGSAEWRRVVPAPRSALRRVHKWSLGHAEMRTLADPTISRRAHTALAGVPVD
jgi:hypothetical protein